MKKGMKRSKKRAVSSMSAKRKRPVAAKAVRRPKATAVKARRKTAPAKPKPKAAVAAKGPSITTLERRIQTLEGQLRARAQDGIEVARWKQYHSQLQDQVKAKDAMLAFKEKELLDLRRQCEELKAQAKKKDK